ncbi:aspartic proteinase CDR1-like [Silene latifolia]|uniref:aspartic proteinase CDR1-like n=1 Tax=Silene latifolia TaxID=37657 RepID=UPI003D782F24
MSHINRFKTSSSSSSSESDIQTQVNGTRGAYVIELSFGTPPVSQIGIIDTGSDLIWTQCQPCKECYKQNVTIFDPSKSSTYKTHSCKSRACYALGISQYYCSTEEVCNYYYRYGDRSQTSGDLATETITFNSDNSRSKGTSLANISFGCGHYNSGLFNYSGSGVVGLGGGPLSLVSQLGSSIKGKFSYCLIPLSKEGNFSGKISFGINGQVTGEGVISTPLIKSYPSTFYHLTLNGVTVGKTKIPFNRNGRTTAGNIVIDSGTTVTFLPRDMYSGLSSALEEVIQGEKVEDKSGYFQLCYKSSNGGDDLNIPNVTANFDGGDLVLKPSNTFVEVSEGVVCLAFLPSTPPIIPIFGNVAQMDFWVGYDLEGGHVSFKPTDCTKA